MAFALPSLPFPNSALEPYVSAKTLDFHHGKHHKTYVDTLNRLIAGKPEEKKSLEEIIVAAHHDNAKTTVQQRRPGVEPDLLLACMAKGGGGEPEGEVKKAIDHEFV